SVFAHYPVMDKTGLESRLAAATEGFGSWSAAAIADRCAIFTSMATLLRRDTEKLAQLATREMGKPIVDTRAEVEKCAALCEWNVEHGPAFLADEPTSVPDGKAWVSFRPLGIVLAVMPWNFPYWQAMRAAVPIMLGGNGLLLKPASNVVGCALELQRLWQEAGLPGGTFSVLNVSHDSALDLLDDSRIAAATVTGSVKAGSAVAARAGKAIKKCVLELGGADPFIVLDDADIDAAVKAGIGSRYANAGQVCIAAKRFILEAGIAEKFTQKFVEATRALKIGDPLYENTNVGPMARADLRDELHEQVTRSIEQGARLLLGGNAGDGAGNYYQATVLADVKPGMVAFDDELFGPVAALCVARDADHAVELANNSKFGLSGALWSEDRERATVLAARMQTGAVFINGTSTSDTRVPIGGVKRSGFGRELSHFGLREFVNAQTVWLDRS
ncbi:MAG: NAD-dependent succinate-semialdehyde dehydrogenase, partial [Dokdonella sp.]